MWRPDFPTSECHGEAEMQEVPLGLVAAVGDGGNDVGLLSKGMGRRTELYGTGRKKQGEMVFV